MAAASRMQNATTDHDGALVRNRCCAIVSYAFARISTPAMGVGEYGVGQRSFAAVCAVTPAKTILPANRRASACWSCNCLSEITGIPPLAGTNRIRMLLPAAIVAG